MAVEVLGLKDRLVKAFALRFNSKGRQDNQSLVARLAFPWQGMEIPSDWIKGIFEAF
jgi:hypothetical protein